MSNQPQPPEVFILVKPPPSKNTHPLNVQIQLVANLTPPTNGAGGATRITSRTSGEFYRSESGASTPGGSFDAVASASVSGGGPAGSGMVRSPSVRSSSVRSGRSGSSSLGSQVGQNQRRVTPLYNLQFHAVMSTVVTDAGTDAKVAKFLKRGVEVHQLAILDPVELFPPSLSSPTPALPPSLPPANDKSLSPPEPTKSAPPSTIRTVAPTESSFLSKLGFKRLSLKANNAASGSGGGGGGTTSLLSPSLSASSLSSKLSAAVSGSKVTSNDSFSAAAVPNSTSTSSGLATLNVVPLFRTPSNPENASSLGAGKSSESVHSATAGASRSTTKAGCGYVWVVRKWLRSDLEGNGKGPQVPTSDLRFEWKRVPKKAVVVSGRRQSVVLLSPSTPGPGNGASSDTHLPRSPTNAVRGEETYSRRSLDQTRPNMTRKLSPAPPPLLAGEEKTLDPNNLGARARPKSVSGARTPDSERSRSPAPNASGGWESEYFDDDSGEESDPEDSERPWTCEVIYGVSSSIFKSPPKRILLATLTPSPHHPKLVAHLAVPFSLTPLPLGTYEPGKGVSNEGLSVEEMKDVVMVTALWLVVRESLGGGGKKRKDKGWRGVKGR